ncbi:MAG: hypothetical protein A3C43_11685 [Candidatus Schekmanbacteria bacterium RIFCSPHIGHO2_02_FULL_38_11]|uniref:Uncharacterized protein n=1 Tax=Candidatus Schekmanbacteria bacterium RIFCSPLOWO2_12_FULL_38_15 TaxID=1817883 RepID=A0A1F7SKX5_9BACT|nr:MAG: hypothetical protein A2043_11700 [Candidatus Schekmanbacteria bacterium GWA2_38_9]OGL48182.1 MAG: hypothetical protein A3H37_04475 [Candidatus Schekmanbacteria bacterium RIFCSPLOWO2_02_FULL_38_14]OGL51358.1 MAG: hypothetical protein A3C43_11685 [Candidatus Schekmanbacteria bacterium RIFCSPHIGHO2_02_FULL_38_11]OGL54411.1 MAG: hypothetical protein A3G31_12280 [Candidatus Schekmanbacteria bacterium RIFCSPLOWO2_12_FULL_38_15]
MRHRLAENLQDKNKKFYFNIHSGLLLFFGIIRITLLKTEKIKKLFLVFFFIFAVSIPDICSSLEPPSNHFSLILDSPMAYVLDRGRLEASFLYEHLDSKVDIFNFRKDNNRTLGNLGDYESYGGMINFGLTESITATLKAEFPKIDYGIDKLKITKIASSLKWNVFKEKSFAPAVSLGINYKYDRGENISRRISEITFPGFSTIILPKPATIEIGGVKDNTYSVSFYVSKLLFEDLVAHGFIEVGRTRVESEFNTSLNIPQIQNLLKGLEYDQNNFSVGVGFHYRIKPTLILNINYKFVTVDRDIDNDIGSDFTKNNIVDVKLNQIINKYVSVTLQGKFYSNNLLGEVPFLYNRLTSEQFNNAYGYIGAVVTFSYDYSAWLH